MAPSGFAGRLACRLVNPDGEGVVLLRVKADGLAKGAAEAVGAEVVTISGDAFAERFLPFLLACPDSLDEA